MKRYGKIAVYTMMVLFFAALVVTWMLPSQGKAAATTSFSFYIHADSNFGFTDIDDAYAIITDVATGDMMDASSGDPNTTWTGCDIAFTKDTQNPYFAGCTIPALDASKTYAIVIYEDVGGDGSEANTDPVRIDAIIFDPVAGDGGDIPTSSDANPRWNNSIKVKVRP